MAEQAELRVIPEGEIKAAMENIAKDTVALKAQMASDRDATKLELDARKDDMKKYEHAMTDIVAKVEAVQRGLHEAKLASLPTGAPELRKALTPMLGEFREAAVDDGVMAKRFYAGADLAESDARQRAEESRATPFRKLGVKHLLYGVQLEDGSYYWPEHDAVKRCMELNDKALFVHAAMIKADGGAGEYQQRGGIRSLGVFRALKRELATLTKADTDLMDTTDIANWIPTGFSPLMYEKVKIGLPELTFHDELAMPTASFTFNRDDSDTEGMFVGQTTTVAGADPFGTAQLSLVQLIDDQKVTLTANKVRTRYLWSGELDEDSIVAMSPRVQRRMLRNMQEALAEMIVNGQKTGWAGVGGALGLDTALTHFGKANDVSVGSDVRVITDGWRKLASLNSATPNTEVAGGNAILSVTLLRSLRRALGEYALDPQQLGIFCSIASYLYLLDDTSLKTIDVFGPQATIKTGQIGAVDNIPVWASRRMPQNEDATGAIANGGAVADRASCVMVHREGCIVGNRRQLSMGMDKWGATDALDMYMFWRGDFQKIHAVGNPYIGRLINLKTV